ncbi:alpha/beta hydrolase family protein [Flavobacterium pectinovorum]|uniref:alpha/beta hydrolase family protein n=1 Tax=Flavobacterium pectinovorum TaxID=29533 RepID=UPI001FAB958C|nr:prolyl oligopeptidase family serine peptidase [Flavobacterium pectinovorum]MCI9843608.1 S9 family peptidase [Flavobacterium pectinovorum]
MTNLFLIKRNINVSILNWLLLLLTCPLTGQAQQKKHLKESDYIKWGTLNVKALSDDGNWTSYQMSYENHLDTLFVQNTHTNKTFAFAGAKDGHFAGKNIFTFTQPESCLKILTLKTGKLKTIESVKHYEVVLDGKYILSFDQDYGKKSLLKIRNDKGEIVDSLANISEHCLSSQKNTLLYTTKAKKQIEVGIIQFQPYSRCIISKDSIGKFCNLVWQNNAESVAFLHEKDSVSKEPDLNYFRIAGKKLFSFDYTVQIGSPENRTVFKNTSLSISPDGKKVFFMEIKKKDPNTNKDSKTVEIWNGNDKWLFIDKQRIESKTGIANLALWYPETNGYLTINNTELPNFMLTGQQDYAVLYDQNAYGLQSKYYDEVDYYLKDLNNDTQNLILKKQSCDPSQIGFDPLSNKILYYKEKNWWIYDPLQNTHINLTGKITTSWDNSTESSAPHQFMVYGNPGWSSNGNNILLYDAYDIWLTATDGSACIRLTEGREKNIVYRIASCEFNNSSQLSYNGRLQASFDMSKDLILSVENTQNHSTGYCILNIHSGIKPIDYGSYDLSEIQRSPNNTYLYKKQTYDQAPWLEIKRKKDSKAAVLFASNKQQKNYFFGKSELLYYDSPKGEELKAALFFPADFDPLKKYPMVVYIYDSMSDEIHRYVNPSLLNSEGFNVTNYTLNGYFVLLPDIQYELGNPGMSALTSVTAAVETATQKGYVDKNKIGLFGHSFGAYQTNFIISQSNLFAAAVSGAGVSDVIGAYFNISRNGIFQSDMWRYESQQFRIGKSLYDDKESYSRNSPILNAQNVKTPLLLWTGKNDRIIPWNQSISYYLALRKLRSKSIMLVYPNEDHSLENTDNQIDLTNRMMQWFDYFLKDDLRPSWITKGVSYN